jgi:glycerol-3-phosphate dehydrogenase
MASNDAVIVGGGTVGVEIALDAFASSRLAR